MFFQLIQVALGRRDRLDHSPSEEEWRGLFREAQRQTLVGVCFSGVERLPEEQRPDRMLILQWYGLVGRMEHLNEKMNALCLSVQQRLLADGFRSCILKGQGMARYYDQPLRRQCGDIDIWLEGGWRKVLPYVEKVRPGGRFVYHHVDFGEVQNVSVEVHFTPSWMYSPFKNRTLQRWFRDHEPECFDMKPLGDDRFVSPPRRFDLIYILLHAYRHIFDDGLGLRQLCDYYFLIIRNEELGMRNVKYGIEKPAIERGLSTNQEVCAQPSVSRFGDANGDQFDYEREIRMLGKGFVRFARSVMWIMGEVFGLDSDHMLLEPDEKNGRFLLSEVMRAGNFGLEERTRLGLRDGTWKKFFFRQKRNLRFLRSYPSEVLWRPYFVIYQLLWRRRAARSLSPRPPR